MILSDYGDDQTAASGAFSLAVTAGIAALSIYMLFYLARRVA